MECRQPRGRQKQPAPQGVPLPPTKPPLSLLQFRIQAAALLEFRHLRPAEPTRKSARGVHANEEVPGPTGDHRPRFSSNRGRGGCWSHGYIFQYQSRRRLALALTSRLWMTSSNYVRLVSRVSRTTFVMLPLERNPEERHSTAQSCSEVIGVEFFLTWTR